MTCYETEARRGRRWGLFFGGVYLVFLSGPAIEEVLTHQPPLTLAVVAAALVVFVAAYLGFWATRSYSPAPSVATFLLIALLTAISVGLTLHNANWIWCFVYCSVSAGASSWNRRVSAGLVIAVAAVTGVLGGLDRATWDSLPYLLLIVGMTGMGMLGWSRMIEANFQLRQAREEVSRLAVAEERLRFARDLHDLLGHSLSVIVLKSELAGRLGEAAPERAVQEIRDVERVAREALREVREAVAGYRQLGLGQELESARATLQAAGVETLLQDLAGSLPTPLDSTLAWALREGVTNVIRHSRARHAEIRVARAGDRVELELLDDGVGCDGCVEGNGLRGLHERVAARDGSLAAGPRPGGGFRLAVSLPLQSAPRPAATTTA